MYLFIAFLSSLAICLLITPVVRQLAQKYGLTDKPDSHRKLHGKPIPMGGGLAVFFAFTLTVLGFWLTNAYGVFSAEDSSKNLWTLLAATSVLMVTGVLDDRFNIRGRHKLLGQILAAAIVVGGGFVAQNISLLGADFSLGVLSAPLTILWLVGAINALNLIDGIDGLATSVGTMLSLAIVGLALIGGHSAEALIAMAMAGALVGFLRFNFPPAKMFLGDTGSMLIGFVVGVLAIRGSVKGVATVALAAPLAVWAIPMLDSAAAIVRRKLTGRSIYTTDRAHMHHCMMERLGSNHRVLAVVAIGCLVTCGGALASVWLNSDLYAVISVACLVGIMVTTRLFGHVETRLLASKCRTASLSLLSPIRRGDSVPANAAVRLQGSRQWELLWDTLVESTEKFSLHSICLDVNLPAAQEGFHATWKSAEKAESDNLWRMSLPLSSNSNNIGRLIVAGQHNERPVCEILQLLVELIEPFESQLAELSYIAPANATLVPPMPVKSESETVLVA